MTSNSGTITVQVGNLALGYAGNGTPTTNTGSIRGQLGTSVWLLGTQSSSGSIEGDFVAFAFGTATVSGSFEANQTEAQNTTFTGTVLRLGSLTVAGYLDLTNATLAPAVANLTSLNLNGTLITHEALTVSGLFTWTGGTLRGVGGQGSLTANGGTAILNNLHRLEGGFHYVNPVGQTATWAGDRVLMNDHSIFDNDGILDLQSDTVMDSDALSEFNNSGTLIKSGGYPNNNGYSHLINNGRWSGFSVGVTSNSGTITVQVGNLALGYAGNGTPTTNTGSIRGQLGTSVWLLGTQSSSGSIEGDFVAFVSGTATVSGSFEANQTEAHGNTTFTGAVLRLGGLTVSGSLNLTNATLAPAAKILPSLNVSGSLLTDDAIAVTGSFTLSSGALITDQDVRVAGLFTWSGGALRGLNGAGSLTANGGTAILGNDFHLLEGEFRYVNPAGQTATWTNGTVLMNDHAIFDNDGALDRQTDLATSGWALDSYDSLSEFNNSGTFVKSGGTGNLWFANGVINNSGTIDVQVGTLMLGYDHRTQTTNTGSIHGAAGTRVNLLGTQTSSGAIQGDRIGFTNGTATVSGSFEAHQTEAQSNTTFTGTVLRLGSLSVAGSLDLTNATLAPAAKTLTSLGLGGTLISDHDLTVSGSFTWNGGTLQGVGGQGSLIVLSDMTLNGNYYVRDFNLINAGHAIWTGGTVNFYGNSRFTNFASATFDDQIDGSFGGSHPDCPVFENQGLFIKSGGNGATNLEMQLYNSGTVRIENGSLNIDCGYVQVVGSGGGAGEETGTIIGDFTGGVSISNPGQLTVEPVPTPPPPVTNYTQTITGSLIELIGGQTAGTEYGQIVVNGDAHLDGTLRVQLINGFAPHLNDQFTIIANRGANAIGGTFAGLPEWTPGGPLVFDRSFGFAVSYVGGAGNDVVLTVVIVNGPPSADAGGPYVIHEGDPLALDASASSDPDHDSLTYSWDVNGDGVFGDAIGGSPTLTWSQLQSLGIDDGLATFSVAVQVDDGHGHVVLSPAVTLTVENTAPTATPSNGGPVQEGSASTVGFADQFDPSAADAANGFLYSYDFNDDGTFEIVESTSASAAVPASLLDDGPGSRTVRARIADKDGEFRDYFTSIAILNVAPTATLNAPSSVAEGSAIALSLTGPFDPSAADTAAGFSYAFDCGDGSGYGAFGASNSASCPTSNDGTRSVKAKIRDTNGSVSEFTANVSVTNAPPVPTVVAPQMGVRGQSLVFTLGASDPSSVDQAAGFSYTINWGDGSVQSVPRTAGNGSGVNVAHIYTEVRRDAAGNIIPYTIMVTATDQDNLSGATTTGVTIAVAGLMVDPADPTKMALFVSGSTGSDKIKVSPAPDDPDALRVKVNERDVGNFKFRGAFGPRLASRIIIFGQAGDDDIQMVDSITLPSELHGDAGNDRISGGGGNDILLGGDGDDLVVGGAGRDAMIGGYGSDRMVGNADDDILIAGSTDFDSNDAALRSILAEWTSNRDYATRVNNLKGTGSGARLNGSVFLAVDEVLSGGGVIHGTVHDDRAVDILTGSQGQDWFLFNADGDGGARDRATDLRASEFASDLDFISGV